MPTGVLHLKEVDTDQITLDGALSVSGASTLEGAIVADSTLSVGGSAKFAATETTNINVEGTLSVSGQTTIGGDIIPDTNDAYDIGSPEFKIRDMYVSDNSLWIGDTTKISNVGGSLKFRKRKTSEVPRAIIDAGASAGHANAQATANAALEHAGVGDIGQMRLQHWHKFMRTLNQAAQLTDIFRDNDDDYEETSASDAWKEINDTKIYTDMNVGVGTSDPEAALHIRGAIKVEDGFSLARNEGNDPSLVIDTRNFGLDETVNDLTGNGFNKYTKLYRVYGTNSQGVGQNWYWGYAQDDYTKFSLSFDGNGGNDPDIAFVFTTASELHCNKVFAALGGNADTATLAATATRLETPRKINGVDFDGTSDITIETGIQGITKPNGGNDVCIQPGKLGVGVGSPGYKLDVESLDFTVARFKQRDAGEGAGIKLENGDGDTWNVATDTDGKFGIYRDGESFSDFSIKDGNVGIGTDDPKQSLHVHGGNVILSNSAAENGNFVHGDRRLALTSDATVLIACDTNDTSGGANSGDIIFGSGSAADTNSGKDFAFSQAFPNGEPRNEHMRIKGSGNVGLGTADPQYKLHVVGDIGKNWGNGRLIMNYDDHYRQGLNFSTPNRTLSMFSTGHGGDGGTLTFNTRSAGGTGDSDIGVERMRIDQNGNVGINTSSPESTLHVNGNAIIGDVGAYGGGHTDAQLTLGGTHNTGYNNNNKVKLLISGGNNDSGSPYYIMCEDENGHDTFYVKGDTSGSGTTGKVFVKGSVGIGTSSPTHPLHVVSNVGMIKCEGDTGRAFDFGDRYFMVNKNSGMSWGDYPGVVYDQSGAGQFRLHGTGGHTLAVHADGGFVPFTGCHEMFSPFTEKDYGKIVYATGEYLTDIKDGKVKGAVKNYITVMDSCPDVKICNKAKDKRVCGVLSTIYKKTQKKTISREEFDNLTNEEKYGYSQTEDEEGVVQYCTDEFCDDFSKGSYNAVGEGGIWVCNANGDIDNGDYITSSDVPGYGQKQDDDLLHNYSVAKATTGADFVKRVIPTQQIDRDECGYVYDEYGNPVLIPSIDSSGTTMTHESKPVRYVDGEGREVTNNEYKALLRDDKPAFVAQFIGCTYHCG